MCLAMFAENNQSVSSCERKNIGWFIEFTWTVPLPRCNSFIKGFSIESENRCTVVISQPPITFLICCE